MGHAPGARIPESAFDYVCGRGNAAIREYAEHANVQVVNMADDIFHLTQAITDILTLKEKFKGRLEKKHVLM